MTVPAYEDLRLECDVVHLEQLAANVLQRCHIVATYSEQQGSILRTFLSQAMERCNEQVRRWMEAAGMRVSLDAAGNLRGVLEAAIVDAPTLIFASHLDTVPDAGRYDGILGVMLAISLVEAVRGQSLPFSIEVIGFSDEEGVRYGLPFLGSRAVTGTLQPAHLRLCDADGISLDAALQSFQLQHSEALPANLPATAAACLEFHIEQGPVLEDADKPLAVVNAIAGQSRATTTFNGRAGHAGTTPMSLRQDALTAAAEWLLAVESIAAASANIVATCGRIVCEPGAANIIPGVARCTLDVRSSDDEARVQAMDAMLASAAQIAARRRVTAAHILGYALPSVALDASLCAFAAECIEHNDRLSSFMVSGAGHDSMILAPHLPAAMIFLRSPGGISHSPDEAVLPGDVVAALRAGLKFLQGFPRWVSSRDVREQGPQCIT